MSEANVVLLHPLDDLEALAWLRANLDGRSETSVSELARQLGWPQGKLRRRLAAWAKAGHITRQPGGRGKVVIAPAVAPADAAIEPAVEGVAAPAVERVAGPAVQLPQRRRSNALPAVIHSIAPAIADAAPKAVEVADGNDAGRSGVAIGAAAVLLATALGLAAVGLTMNARFAASFGQTTEAAVILAAIGLAIDVLAVVLPTVAALLWHHRARWTALLAWTIWLVALTMTLLAAMGFAATNIGDAVAGRAKVSVENSALAERIERLRRERAGISEAGAVSALEAALQQAQPGAQAVWKSTSGCHDVTLPSSGRACAAVLELRERLANAQRRDAIDAETRAAESRFAALPAIATADPQAAAAAEIVGWISAGRISPTPHDVHRLRTIGLTITPALAGLVAMLALTLLRAREKPIRSARAAAATG
jgi:hypothetical protein